MKEKETKQEQSSADVNLRFYSQGCEVPSDALKPIRAGRLKGMSDVNPMWRMKRMTEIFGPCGFGWKYEITRQWTEVYGEEVKCFCNILLYVRDPETKEWSAGIPGNGGSAIVQKESKGCYVNDEGYKMALTDALSIAMKPLGIGANIWYGAKATGHNESKYEYYTQQPQQHPQQQTSPTEAQMQQAVAEMNAARSVEEYNAVWNKWATGVPAVAVKGTPFYNATLKKSSEFQKSKAS